MYEYERRLQLRLSAIRDELRRLLIHQEVHSRMDWPEEPSPERFRLVMPGMQIYEVAELLALHESSDAEVLSQ